MNKILFTIFVILFPYAGIAQDYKYISFPKTDATWSEHYIFDEDDYLENPSMESYELFTINGEDTVINNYTYKKIYMHFGEKFDKNQASYIGSIREDNEKKIWFKGDKIIHRSKPYTIDKEILLYDFSAKVGDVIKVGTIEEEEDKPVVVEKIDTIKIGNSLRKKFTLKASNSLKFEWIEGIGSLNGLFYCSHIAIPTKNIDQNGLVGFMLQNDILYFNEKYSSFYPTSNESIELPEHKLTATPYSESSLLFKFHGLRISYIRVFNVSGAMVENHSVVNKNDYLMSTSHLRTGIYIYQGVVVDGKTYTGKFVIK